MAPKTPPRGSMVDRRCEVCGKTFPARTADVARGWGRFCSKACAKSTSPKPREAAPANVAPFTVYAGGRFHLTMLAAQLRLLASILEDGRTMHVSGGLVITMTDDGAECSVDSDLVLAVPAEVTMLKLF